MIIVGKSKQEPNNGPVDYVEVSLPQYRAILSRKNRFSYAWTFNPDDEAIAALRENLPFRPGLRETLLYLIGQPWYSPLRMRVIDFHHDRKPVHCLKEWRPFCTNKEWCIDQFPDWLPIHLWFLVDKIEPVKPPLDVKRLTAFFMHKYTRYGQNNFGFYRDLTIS